MSKSKKVGDIGESIVCNYLEKNNYRLLARNYHTRYGEIDIIAESTPFIVFVEVKVRKFGSMVSGVEAVNLQKQRKIIKTAQDYLSKNNLALQPRFDVIELIYYLKNGSRFLKSMRHLENAFGLDESYSNDTYSAE